MIAQTSGLTISPALLLWLVFSLAAVLLLFSALNRRRSSLTDALKAFVDRHNKSTGTSESAGAAGPSASNDAKSQKLAEKIQND